jgi:hypothetical protein
MVDVVVDGKVAAKAPYDPEDIPLSVRKRAAAVDKLYGDGNVYAGQPIDQTPILTAAQTTNLGVNIPAQQAAPPAPVAPVVQAPPAPAAPPDPAPAPVAEEDPNSNTWKSRHLALQGRHEKEVTSLQDTITQLGNELLHTQQQQRRAPPRAKPPAPPPTYLTENDVQNYGREWLDVAQRAAMQVVEPKLRDLEAENANLRKQQEVHKRRMLDQQVELAVPDFREFDRNPRWHQWLLGIDPLSGRVRQDLLNESISAGNAPRVLSFFNGFKKEEVATGQLEAAPSQLAYAPREPVIPLHSLATPGRARPATGGDASLPQDKPTYTRAQIAELYRLRQRGAYVGRDADWARQEADLYAAQREGRIR